MKTVARFASRFQFWISRAQLGWLEQEAVRRSLTMADVLRSLIEQARDAEIRR